MQAGGCENFAADSRTLLGNARAAGVEAELDIVEDMQHGFQLMAGAAPEADASIARLAAGSDPSWDSTATEVPEMALEIHPMCLGEVVVDGSFLVWGWNAGQSYRIPFTSYLILGGDHPVMVDAGAAQRRGDAPRHGAGDGTDRRIRPSRPILLAMG